MPKTDKAKNFSLVLCKPKKPKKYRTKNYLKEGVDKKACIISCSQTYTRYPQARAWEK